LLCPANYLLLGAEHRLGTVRLGLFTRHDAAITDRIRIIRHEAVPKPAASRSALRTDARRGFSIGMVCPGRRLRPDMLISEQALEQARALAQAQRDATD
jgi:hypothetical protein